MAARRKFSTPATQLLLALLESPTDEAFGFELTSVTGLASGTVYPILRRFEDDGLIKARWDEVESSGQRRRRRYYRLTGAGRRVAYEATSQHREAIRIMSPGWGIA